MPKFSAAEVPLGRLGILLALEQRLYRQGAPVKVGLTLAFTAAQTAVGGALHGALGDQAADLGYLVVAAAGLVFGPRYGVLSAALLVALDLLTLGSLQPPHGVVLFGLAVLAGRARMLIAQQRSSLAEGAAEAEAHERRLSAVVDNAPIVLFAVDRRGAFTLRRGRLRSGSGLSGDELIGRSVFEVLQRSDRDPRLADYLRRALAGEEFVGSALIDGRVLETHYTPVRDAAGEVVEVIGVALDITERERAREGLVRSEARLEAIVGSTSDGIVTADREGNVIQFNVGAERMFGRPAADVLGRPVGSLVPPRLREGHARVIGSFVEHGGTARHLSAPGRLVGLRASGEEFPAEATISRVEAGKEVLSTVILRDITERLRTENDLARRSAELGGANAALRETSERLQTILTNAPVILFVLDPQGIFTLLTGQGLASVGALPGLAVGRSAFVAFKDLPEILAATRRALGGESGSAVIRGRTYAFDARYVAVRDGDGAVSSVIGVALDVTRLERTRRQLRLLAAAAENAADPMIITDAGAVRTVRYVNPAFTTVLGYAGSEVVRRPDPGLGAPSRDVAALARQREAAEAGETAEAEVEVEARRKDGSTVPLESRVATIRDAGGRVTHLVTILHDLTSRRRQRQELDQVTLYDGLTGLPNRALFLDRVERTIRAAAANADRFALLYLDIDRFAAVNDGFGRGAGDAVLAEVGRRVERLFGDTGSVARFGGDEFAVLLPRVPDAAGALVAADRIAEALRRPLPLAGGDVTADASIGIALFPEHGRTAEELLHNVDAAMYRAKRAASGHAVYTPEIDRGSQRRAVLEAELRRSIVQGELVLHYQPIVTIATRECVGVEALVRWQHPSRGLLPPGDFIPLAEGTGYIKEIALWTLDEGLRRCAAWQTVAPGVSVSVNLSTRNLRDPAIVPSITDLLRTWSVPRGALTLEMTEGTMMGDPEGTLDVLGRLAAEGVSLSIDDFGTGYSSLSYLQRLPVRELKIDRSFVKGLLGDPASEKIVRSTIDLAHSLGLIVVAEGVEDEETLLALGALGCDRAQGYHIGRPMPFGELRALLRAGARAKALEAGRVA